MADKRYVGTAISDEDYHALVKMATARGQHPSALITEYIQTGIERDVDILSDEYNLPIELLVYRELQSVRAKNNTRNMLLQMAGVLLSNPDEDLADRLSGLCAQADVSFDGLMKEAQDTAMIITLPLSLDSSTAKAKSFLLELFKNRVEIKAGQVYDTALSKGYSKSIVRQAARELGIMPVRRSTYWVWVMPVSMNVPQAVEVRHA